MARLIVVDDSQDMMELMLEALRAALFTARAQTLF